MKSVVFRRLCPFFFAVMGVAACAGSSGPTQGATSPQASDRCLALHTACNVDGDCCSLWCVNGECRQKQP
jgi:hypothetical protein